MWPHQSGLREILRCVCYEKMEERRASCAAARGAFGFLCSRLTPARKLPGTRGCGARQPLLLPTAALRRCHGTATMRGGAAMLRPRRSHPTGLPPLLGKAAPDVLSHGAVPRNDAGSAPLARARRRQGAGSIPRRTQQMFPLLPASPGCL